MDPGWQRPRLLSIMKAAKAQLQVTVLSSLSSLSPTTALLFRVRMMKRKGRKCPHPQRHPCLHLCPRLQTKSLSARTTILKVGPSSQTLDYPESPACPHVSQTGLFLRACKRLGKPLYRPYDGKQGLVSIALKPRTRVAPNMCLYNE